MNALKHFRQNLAAAMADRGLTQRALADKSGVTYVYINRILVGRSDPSVTICDKLSDALSIPFDTMIKNPKIFSKDILTLVKS